MNEHTIIITEKDYERLQELLRSHYNEDLEVELERAKIISDKNVPKNLVTMNSKVRFHMLPENQERVVTLVYPEDVGKDKVSVLGPVGGALLGLSVNQKINWMFPDGKTRTIRILEVIYQPEFSGHWHL